jgi:hypothetical protein
VRESVVWDSGRNPTCVRRSIKDMDFAGKCELNLMAHRDRRAGRSRAVSWSVVRLLLFCMGATVYSVSILVLLPISWASSSDYTDANSVAVSISSYSL